MATRPALSIKVASARGQTKVVLSGNLNEDGDFGSIRMPKAGTIEFDMAALQRCNSSGILRWVRFLKTIPEKVKVVLANCSTVVVRQCNMLPAFTGHPNLEIKSFYVAHMCPECGGEKDVLLTPDAVKFHGGDVELSVQARCEACGAGTLVVQEHPEKQFLFLCRDDAAQGK